MAQTPIVVVAFNRPQCLARILQSLSNAKYEELEVPLFISIDFAKNNADVIAIAESFNWGFGKKTVLTHKENLGLRKHVLQCGSLALEHGSIIVLEDDLLVSPSFYSFALRALEFVENNDEVGGVSLYNHQYNVQNLQNFSPIEDGYDNWYFQFASSWGQAWTKKQWKQFLRWYDTNPDLSKIQNIPERVIAWSEKSWLKYFVTYLIVKNKYFLYPKISLTTNFGEVGTHNSDESTAYQVPLRFGVENRFSFSSLKESNSVYDAFFENTKISEYQDIEHIDLCVSLYGYKPLCKEKQFFISSKKLNFKILKTYGCSLKPMDANILLNIAGNQIFLYDTSEPSTNIFKETRYNSILYNVKIIIYDDLCYLFYKGTIKKIKNVFRKLTPKTK